MTKLAKEMFISSKFNYDPADQYWLNTDPNSPNKGKFALSEMLNSSGPLLGDCRDVSSYLFLAGKSIGLEPTCQVAWTAQWDLDGSPRGFVTNNGNGIGGGSTYTEWWGFNYHQVVNLSGKIFDAAVAQPLDPSGAAYYAAPANWIEADYWQSAGGIRGLARCPIDLYPGPATCPKYFRPATVGIYERPPSPPFLGDDMETVVKGVY